MEADVSSLQRKSKNLENGLVIVPKPNEPFKWIEGEGLLNLIGYAVIPLETYYRLLGKDISSIAQVK